MCFIKSSKPKVPKTVQQDPVIRHQADAEKTKNSKDENLQGYNQNLKTTPIGLTDEAKTDKKTLLGE